MRFLLVATAASIPGQKHSRTSAHLGWRHGRDVEDADPHPVQELDGMSVKEGAIGQGRNSMLADSFYFPLRRKGGTSLYDGPMRVGTQLSR
jgi:hypothetical protein